LVLKVCREFDDVTLAGKLFHVHVPWRLETLSRRQSCHRCRYWYSDDNVAIVVLVVWNNIATLHH